ncbi:MAG: YfhO family protein [Bacteroidota bacterium]
MNFKSLFPHLIAVAIFAAIAAFYFHPQFSGKILRGQDLTSHRGMAGESAKYSQETGEKILWTNGMFGGMPTYQINRITEGNLLIYVQKGLALFFSMPFGVFFAAMIGFYLMAILLGVNHWLSMVGAISFGVATNDFILFDAGHANKVMAIAYFPIIVAGVTLAFRKKYLIGGLLFGIGMGINLLLNHPQMTIYLAMTMLIYGMAHLVQIIKEQDWMHLGKLAAALGVGLLLGMGSAASNVLPTLEYSKDTMRGKPILTPPASGEAVTSSQTEGLAWDYAMNWSNNGKDLIATLIPYAAGGGSLAEVGADSPFGDAVRQIGGRAPASVGLPLYHGGLNSTVGPAYLGALLWFLFLVGALLVRGPIKWWLVGGVILTMMLSLGKNFASFNHFIFDYFPLYNKFRAPSSIMSITDFLMAILAILGLHRCSQLISSKQTDLLKKNLLIAGGVLGGIALFFWLLGPSVMTFSGDRDAIYAGQFLGQNANQSQISTLIRGFEETRMSLLRQDALRTFAFIALGFGVLWLYVGEKISTPLLAVALSVLVVVDFTGITYRYYTPDNFSTKRQEDASFAPSPADQQILADNDPNFRVFNQTVADPFQDASTSYLHKSIGGYHPAKLQRYDDIITRHLRAGNQAVFNMLNAKYFIQRGQNGAPAAARNPGALGHAWLVSAIQNVSTADEEINALGGNFNAQQTAVIHQEFSDQIAGLSPNGQGTVELTSYKPSRLVYNFNSGSDQLAVFSEVWYGPGKGWTATIDGNEVDIIRANYVLRALKVPAGQHEIVFAFEPATYSTGVLLSYLSSLLLLGGLIFMGYRLYQHYTPTPTEPKPVPAAPVTPAPVKPKPKTKSKPKNKKKKRP